MQNIKKLVRPHLLSLQPYSSARDEFSGTASVYLDANENALGSITDKNHNRYPDPYQSLLKEKIGSIKGISKKNIFVGNGSDEAIDLLFRVFCNPETDNAIITPPTYGMYEVSANINNVNIKKVGLTSGFQLETDQILSAADEHTKLIFMCSPNNPTGNELRIDDVLRIVKEFSGIVVVDEAYIDFSSGDSLIKQLSYFPNLVILQTMSKAWGLASLRLGFAFASEEIVYYLNRIKPPYNISGLTQETVLLALNNLKKKEEMVQTILKEREFLSGELTKIPAVEKIFPTDANFILVKTINSIGIYNYLVENSIIVRRPNVKLFDNCLRITVGTREENQSLLESLLNYKN